MSINGNARIFISHSSKDEDVARVLCQLLCNALSLEKKDIVCSSVDGHRFGAGIQIDETIITAISGAQVLIGLISDASAESAYVIFELGVGWGAQKKVMTLLTPGTGAEALQGPLRGFNALSCTERGNMRRFLKDVAQALGMEKNDSESYDGDLDALAALGPTGDRAIGSAFTFANRGRLLAVGAHWDDLLLGCLGTMIKLRKLFYFEIDVVVLCNLYSYGYFGGNRYDVKKKADEVYDIICKREGFNNISPKLRGWMKDAGFNSWRLSDREFASNEQDLAPTLQAIKNNTKRHYNLVFSPPARDRNPDHALTAESVFTAFRDPDNLVLEYDIKRYTEYPFVTSLCIGLDDTYEDLEDDQRVTVAERKIDLLTRECRIAKKGKDDVDGKFDNAEHLFSEEALKARMFINAQDNSKNRQVKYAELFHGRIEL